MPERIAKDNNVLILRCFLQNPLQTWYHISDDGRFRWIWATPVLAASSHGARWTAIRRDKSAIGLETSARANQSLPRSGRLIGIKRRRQILSERELMF